MTDHDQKVKAALQQHGRVLEELLQRVAALEQGKRPAANGQPSQEQAAALGSDEQEGVEDGY